MSLPLTTDIDEGGVAILNVCGSIQNREGLTAQEKKVKYKSFVLLENYSLSINLVRLIINY